MSLAIAVTELPVVEFGHDQISFAQLVTLIGADAAADLVRRSHRDLGWVVDRYDLHGLWLWVDVSWECEAQPVIRHYYGE